MSDIPNEFTSQYYDQAYFADQKGKEYRKVDGKIDNFGYKNEFGEWLGCAPITNAWKILFNPRNLLDVGAGRGTFLTYCRDIGIQAVGFDYSDFGVNNPYNRCKKEWIFKHDCTQPFPYKDSAFDMVTVLDLMEHIYSEDSYKVISEVFRVTNRFAFFLIATVGAGSGVNIGVHTEGYILKRGETIPIELEACAAAGHVTVMTREWWEEKLMKINGWEIRRDLETEFRRLVPANVLANWKTVIILEKNI